MQTIPADQLSTAIVYGLRLLLQAAVDAGTITDVKAGKRAGKADMVLSEFPDSDVFYPHIVVGEAADASAPLDIRTGRYLHQYTVKIDVHETNSTRLYTLRDQVRNWIEANTRVLCDAGWNDPVVVNSASMEIDQLQKTTAWRILVQGEVYTIPTTSALVRRISWAGTAAQFTAANPTLGEDEIGHETDTNNVKIGDGVHAWTDLSYV